MSTKQNKTKPMMRTIAMKTTEALWSLFCSFCSHYQLSYLSMRARIAMRRTKEEKSADL